MGEYLRMYKKYDKSEDIFDKLENYIPGGVNSPIMTYKTLGIVPPVIKSAYNSRVEDVDGNVYIDYVCGWGAMILGHSKSEVIEAVKISLINGLNLSSITELEYKLTRLINKAVPSIKIIKYVNSQTEGIINAIGLARKFTKKNKIVKFYGAFHGIHEEMINDKNDSVIFSEFNDFESIINMFNNKKNDIAAIIVEPIIVNSGVIIPKQGFLELLRIITQKRDALLIFDETNTGFRTSFECAQGYFNVRPDMTVLGKIIGGGIPINAIGGRREIMELLEPIPNTYHANAVSPNPLILAAGVRTLEILKDDKSIYKRIDRKATLLEKSIIEVSRKYNAGIKINRFGSMISVLFNDFQTVNYENFKKSNQKKYEILFRNLLLNGVNIAPSHNEIMFISDAHTDDDIENTIVAFEKALKLMRVDRII